MNAAEDLSSLLDAMPDDAALAMRAPRGKRMDRAFEAVEDVGFPAHDYFECFVIFVSANFAFSHYNKLFARAPRRGCDQHPRGHAELPLHAKCRRSAISVR
jgi:hypothetical protein